VTALNPHRDGGVVDTGARTAPYVSLSEAEARALLEEVYGRTGALVRFATEKDDTFRVDAPDGRFVLKVANPAETAEELDFQVELMRHAAAADPGLPLPAALPSRRACCTTWSRTQPARRDAFG
jgi:Ser/Thr protein kinase RdoA (MazF antagonist)